MGPYRVLPVAVSGVAGTIDGALQDYDANTGRTRQGFLHQRANWFRLAEVALGYLGASGRYISADYAEPLFYGGVYGLTTQLGTRVGSKLGSSSTATGAALPALPRGSFFPATSRMGVQRVESPTQFG